MEFVDCELRKLLGEQVEEGGRKYKEWRNRGETKSGLKKLSLNSEHSLNMKWRSRVVKRGGDGGRGGEKNRG